MTTTRDVIDSLMHRRASANPGSDLFATINPYVLSPAEITAGVTPTDFSYPVGDVRRYGAKGNWNGTTGTDDTAAINNACLVQAAAGGGRVWIDGTLRCLVNSANIQVGNGAVLTGPHERPGLPEPYTSAGLYAFGGSIWLNPSFTINLAPGTGTGSSVAGHAGVRGLAIFRAGANPLTIPTTDPQAVTELGNFSGVAITIPGLTTTGDQVGIDCYIGHAFIVGFTTAITSAISDRTVIEYVSGDCTNGIYLADTFDLARISHCHFWSFVTYLLPNEYWRTGIGYQVDTGGDWTTLVECFDYGHTVSFKLAANSVRCIGCAADGNAPNAPANSYGFQTLGNTVTDIELIGCRSSAHIQSYHLSCLGYQSLSDCAGWGGAGSSNPLVYANAGRLSIHGGFYYSASTTGTFIQLDTGLTYWNIEGVTFDGEGFTVTSLNINSNVSLVGELGPCLYVNGATEPLVKDQLFGTTGLQRSWYGIPTGPVDAFYQASGTPQAPTASASNVALGSWAFNGFDGSSFFPASGLRGQLDGAVGAGSMPGKLIFSTTVSGASTLTDRAVFDNAGNFWPVTDNATTCGKSGARWSAVWAANGAIQTSDARQKNVLGDAPGLEFISLLHPVRYRWKIGGNKVLRQVGDEIVTEAIPGKREHWGLIAQEVKSAADKLGLDFGGWVKTDTGDSNSEEGLRYDQLIAPLVRSVQELSARVTALEAR